MPGGLARVHCLAVPMPVRRCLGGGDGEGHLGQPRPDDWSPSWDRPPPALPLPLLGEGRRAGGGEEAEAALLPPQRLQPVGRPRSGGRAGQEARGAELPFRPAPAPARAFRSPAAHDRPVASHARLEGARLASSR